MVGDDLKTTVGQLHLVLSFTQNKYNYHEGCGVAQLVVRRLDVGHHREVFLTELASDEEMVMNVCNIRSK
jgi:hypothetical protein